jgi:hypothetical protein
MIASCKSPSNRDTCRFRFSFQFAQIEHLATFYNVGQQNIYEGVLPIERGTSPIFGRNDSIDCSEVAFAERVVFRAKETSTPSVGLFGIGAIVHDAPVYERRYPFRPIPSMQKQSIAVVWAVVDDKTCQSDWGVLFVASVFTLEDPPAGVTEGTARLGCPRNTSGLASASAFLTSYCAISILT